MALMPSKICPMCGKEFFKRYRDSFKQWSDRMYCSRKCGRLLNQRSPILKRFLQKIKLPDDCIEWTGQDDGHGYGIISIRRNQSPLKAHRLSYEFFYGKIPDGLCVLHKCDNPVCINPKHLEAGTHKKNMQDASKRGRLNPKSLLNLRPGAKGVRGAGPISNKEILHGKS